MKTIFKSKNLSNFKIQNFATKYIRARNTQEHYDKLHMNKYIERRKFKENRPTRPIFPTLPQDPDLSISLDAYDDEHITFNHFNLRQRRFTQNRARFMSEFATKKLMDTREDLKKFDIKKLVEINKTLLIEEEKDITPVNIEKMVEKMSSLVDNLGYLDFREFIALNRYILETKLHNDIIIRAKGEFLQLAINSLNETKKKELRKTLKVIIFNESTLKKQNCPENQPKQETYLN